MPEYGEIVAKLTGFGKVAGAFRQRTRGQTAGLAPRYDHGFCTGVCLDWSRRVLLGGKVKYAESDASVTSRSLQQSQLHGMAQARRTERNHEIVPLVFAMCEVVNAQGRENSRNQRNDPVDLSRFERQLAKYIPDYRRSPNGKYEPATAMAWVTELNDEVPNRYEYGTPAGWEAVAKLMDDSHVSRVNRGASRRPYSEIKIESSAVEQHYGDHSSRGAITKVLELVRLPDFEGKVINVGFTIIEKGSRTGHMVAIYRYSHTWYIFFEPNYGVYAYEIRGLVEALGYLFGGVAGHDGIYNLNEDHVNGAIDYIIFARKAA